MVWTLGLVFGAYLGVRLYEVTQDRPANRKLQHLLRHLSLRKEQAQVDDNLVAHAHDETQRLKHYVKISGLSFFTAIARYVYPPLTIVTVVLCTYTAIPYLRQTETSLFRDRRVDGYVLYAIADMMMLWLGALCTAALGIGLLHASRFILSSAKDKSKEMVVDAFAKRPAQVWVLKEGVEIQIPLSGVEQGDTVVINTGEIIAVDGVITEGLGTVDQHALTGESQPAEKHVGEQVYASTILISGRICVRVEQSGQETTVAKIGDIINNTIDFKSSSELKGEQWANAYNLPLVGLAAAVWPVLGPVGAVGVLYSHIANTIRVVAPLSTLNYLNIALEHGILIKDGRVLEDIRNLDTVVFDKTGTLTREIPEVERILLCDGELTRDEILFYAAAAECRSTHPIAKAILKKAEEQNLLPPKIEESSYKIGYGVAVTVEGRSVLLGSRRYMENCDITVSDEVDAAMEEAYAEGHSAIVIAIDGKVRGIFEMHTKPRPEVTNVICLLKNMGVKHMAIISGDHEKPTKALASALGMDDCYYDVLPEHKAEIVEKLQQEGKKVAFVGDGVNDVIAMKKAEVSISLSGATSIATDVAQIVLLEGTLTHLPYLLELSLALDRNLKRSLAVNVIPSAITLSGVLFFKFGMLTSILISQSPLVLGAANALMPFEIKRHEIEQECSEIESSGAAA